jgi:hypothetical protein
VKTFDKSTDLMPISSIFILALSAALFACSSGTSKAQRLVIKPAGGQVNLTEVLPGVWGRVCVISPYSTNKHAREIIGFPVNIESKSSINMSDSIALLVTMQGQGVSALFEVPRGSVDFANLGGKCYRRGDSRFTVPDEGHPYAVYA